MRRHLTGAIVLVSIITLALYAIPRTVMLDDLVRNGERRALWDQAALVATAIDERVAGGRAIDEALLDDLAGPQRQIVVTSAGGVVVAGEAPEGDVIVATAPLTGGGDVELRLQASSVDDRVTDVLRTVLALAAGVSVVAVLLAVVAARRVVRPFTDLASHAADLGPEIHDPAPRSGIPEADRIAEALDRSRDRLAQLLTDERNFSANASHQLRTPLAALRLRLEDLTLWPETDDAVRAELGSALGEVDRLSGTIDDLLKLARRGGLGTAGEVDLVEAACGAVDRWQAAYEEVSRTVTIRAEGPVTVPASLGAVVQVLDVLLENALVHGSGSVTVSVAEQDGTPCLRVADDGSVSGIGAEELFERSRRGKASAGEGIGLALARTLAGAVGARLRLVSKAPTEFELSFPRRG